MTFMEGANHPLTGCGASIYNLDTKSVTEEALKTLKGSNNSTGILGVFENKSVSFLMDIVP